MPATRSAEAVQVRCALCRSPWLISRDAFDRAAAIILDEFPDGSVVAMPTNIGYACPECASSPEKLLEMQAGRAGRTRKKKRS